jgi:hypothetical protein
MTDWKRRTYVFGSRLTLVLMFLMITALAIRQAVQSLPAPTRAAEGPPLCNLGSVPSDIQSRLKADFGSWKTQEPENLSEYTRKTWEGRKPPTCPGIAVGLFQSAKTPSYALLLVPIDHPDAGYRFLVFSRKTGQPSYETTVVEKSDDHGASNYFIRKVSVRQFFSEQSKRKFQVESTDCILMVDSAEQEYGTNIYFWSNGHFRQEPVDD